MGGGSPATPAGRLWEIELLDTVIFPEGELGGFRIAVRPV